MPTPDFEDWLMRYDFPIEDTVTLDKFMTFASDKLGLTGGSLDTAERIYTERYKGLEEYGIRAVERHYMYRGEPFVETRYAIKGEPGLWGRERAYTYAEDRARLVGDYDVADALLVSLREMRAYPERYRRIEEE